MEALRKFLLLLMLLASIPVRLCDTDPQDVAALQSFISGWQDFPSNWKASNDPCGTPWDGVMCDKGRVTSLRLSGIIDAQGTLSNSVGQLNELVYLDLSFNIGIGGPLPDAIRNLKKLTTLYACMTISKSLSCIFGIHQSLAYPTALCFSGSWLAAASQEASKALNSNNFTGGIPPSFGLLSNLFWLDLADNQLSGSIPISSGGSPGLDLLTHTKHFHFNKNQLSGSLAGLFNSSMILEHILFDHNQLSGPIPPELGGIATLKIIRLDRNNFTGEVPANISKLDNLNLLNLANNQLNGTIPDLSSLSKLNVVDLSNNSFDPSVAPNWFSTLQSLTSVILSNNALNGTLEMTGNITQQLKIVNLFNNRIFAVNITPSYNKTLVLVGNPVCLDSDSSSRSFCSLQQEGLISYSTNITQCGSTTCSGDQSLDPATCSCAYPYTGKMIFRAPLFADPSDRTTFQQLETSLWKELGLRPGAVFLSGVLFSSDDYLQVQVSNIINVNYVHIYIRNSLVLPISGGVGSGKSQMSKRAIAGTAVGCSFLLLALMSGATFAILKKRRPEQSSGRANPFASWGVAQKDSGGAPQLKGARFFSFDELKNCTNNFSENHEIGSGGYGKVYKGTIEDGTGVAIKRAEYGSKQGAVEFKNEIELLSRVHHRNLVSLLGFCYEQGEQMLVYEYVSNGTLRENLQARGIYLDWKKRLRIALGSARGLAYLHELADPPIIHRDIKSTNILLDDNLKAKVADFGLSKLVADTEKGHVSTQVKGTLGYLDPEYYMTQQLSEKSDVYSFGVVMLELLSARLPITKGRYIVREFRIAIDPNEHDYYGLQGIIDPAIHDAAKSAGFRRFVQLAMECVEESASKRPTMSSVVKEIETMLQNEGLSSSSSSVTEFEHAGQATGGPYSGAVVVTGSSSSSSSISEEPSRSHRGTQH
ncbi:leucine-rich repeat receptor protein kinase HPCA1-like [Triticum aestivum]|uniref:leucine-rich repeat receptor protein kinase HPCA1-like n=1 Tax=Triticum aestivum TaxID=4565 RepID=UPI001D03393B|nr:leucine-rich repeat receptor protein kinase HPCA1-like [Triticum aestivum]